MPKVLVVDDEEEIRTSLCEIIRHVGHPCSGAADAEQALALLERNPVDVVITDIVMPGANGFELTEIIKKKYDCDVILITGYGGDFSYEEALEKGASDFAQKPVRPKELVARLKRVLRERELIAERRRMEARLRELTVTDDLTKLYNSRHFFRQIQSEIDRAARYDHPLSLLLLDVDGFKRFNDTYGHLEGDRVLMALGGVIQNCMRKNDSGYRYGGDEFTVILPMTRGREAVTVAERIRKGFRAEAFSPESDQDFQASVSIGITQCRPGEGWQELTKRADKAMYEAKSLGGNRSCLL
ncbi:MAG: diguanylate cyclase [Deltaproteobacteria bacterium]|nr:diguanylate cyclase [Deltaproteobacteria bacterium]